MEFISEESQKDKRLRQQLEDMDAFPKRKAKTSRGERYFKLLEKQWKQKQERLEWQKESQKRNRAERARLKAERKQQKLNKPINIERISDKDKDPTAAQKSISGIASYSKALLNLGARKAIPAAKKKLKKLKKEKAKKNAFMSGLKSKMSQKLLPGSSERKALPGGKSPVGLLQPTTIGRMARKDPEFKKKQIKLRGGSVTEQFSCWREEFLYELGDLRKKKKEKTSENTIIDVMSKKEKNLITIGPEIKEEYLTEKNKRNALLALSFGAGLLQSPYHFVSSGAKQAPGNQLMARMMEKRRKANRNLDSPRVSEPARNKKIEEENLDKIDLYKTIVKKLIDEKKRKNTLLNKGYIGESNYSKENLKCNKPKSDPVGDSITGKSHVVKACDNGEEKLIRFGQRGVKGSPKKEGESEDYANRRKKFKARHAKNIAKGKMSAAYWADRVKW